MANIFGDFWQWINSFFYLQGQCQDIFNKELLNQAISYLPDSQTEVVSNISSISTVSNWISEFRDIIDKNRNLSKNLYTHDLLLIISTKIIKCCWFLEEPNVLTYELPLRIWRHFEIDAWIRCLGLGLIHEKIEVRKSSWHWSFNV
jgi:hypothetical protein